MMELNFTRMFMLFILINVKLIGAETVADKGKATVTISGISKQQFEETTKSTFQTAISRYASEYCKPEEGRCRSSDKHIRAEDVIIINVFDESEKGCKVEFYLRDVDDKNNPALTTQQLEDFLSAFMGKIKNTYGLNLTLILASNIRPLSGGAIAGIVICSVAVVVFIIIAICLVRRDTLRKRKEMLISNPDSDESRNRLSRLYDNVKIEVPATNTTGQIEAIQPAEAIDGRVNVEQIPLKRAPSDPYAYVAAVEKEYYNTDNAISTAGLPRYRGINYIYHEADYDSPSKCTSDVDRETDNFTRL